MRRRFLNSIQGKRIDTSKQYFAIEALEDGVKIQLNRYCEYCVDDGIWRDLKDAITLNIGQKIYFRGNLTPISTVGIGRFTISKKCNLSGNIMSLLFGDDFEGQINLTGYNNAFSNLFYNCINIIDASQLILPATTLAKSCYYGMFQGCTSLTTAPELPATTLAMGCYYYMFSQCTSLVTAPVLPARILKSDCYQLMFSDCTSLVTAPELPATTLATNCYERMFMGCSKLNYIKALFTTTPDSLYTGEWVSGVSSTGTFVKNKNATWNVTGVNGIPSGWTVQTV